MLTLKGNTTQLRALEPEDVDVIYKWENNPAIWTESGTVAPYSRFVLNQYLSNAHLDLYTTKELRLVIEKFEGTIRKPIGCIDLFDFDPQHARAGVGILIGDPAERQKGHANEALKLLVSYAFQVLHLHQLHCGVAVGNEPSLRLFNKNGFEIIGTKKHWLKSPKGWIDEYTLQLVSV
jgi:diamine N-acetyltransferase